MEGFKGQVMCLTYWKAAKATFPRQFEEAMSKMRSLSESAEAWLCDKDPRNCIWLVYVGNEKYEVDCGLGNKHVVDLLNSSYSYRK
ncbi:hypothetical protein GOBAR_AA10493 [Gossypium barbadense]|uniref:Uncharacterized protein n=1 Tax=Gossypium barbadense TaxID=3634 RepID=A0A2P5Y3H5_GOSBA|nr:hypothetical protein GOBAR_AA10493 [Gossypium barbadense]